MQVFKSNKYGYEQPATPTISLEPVLEYAGNCYGHADLRAISRAQEKSLFGGLLDNSLKD